MYELAAIVTDKLVANKPIKFGGYGYLKGALSWLQPESEYGAQNAQTIWPIPINTAVA